MNTAADVFGIARQAAKGTLETNPTFAHGLAGGGLAVDPSQEPDKLTSAYLSAAGAFRDKIENGFSIETRAFQKAIGLYLYAIMGGLSTTGEGPYVHTITLGSSNPYLSAFEKKYGPMHFGLRDCKLDELSLEWEENKPVVVKLKGMGTVLSFPVSFTPTVDETDTDDYYTPVGGTFKLDLDSATPAVVPVRAGKFTIKRGVETPFFSGAIEAGDANEGACSAEASLTIRPDDLTVWRNALTGATNGASIMTTPQYGSAEVTFVAGSDSLKIAGSHIAFLCDLPEADPEGGAVDCELAGEAFRGTGTTPLTFTLTNTQASY
jgi:hypothetical protein